MKDLRDLKALKRIPDAQTLMGLVRFSDHFTQAKALSCIRNILLDQVFPTSYSYSSLLLSRLELSDSKVYEP